MTPLVLAYAELLRDLRADPAKGSNPNRLAAAHGKAPNNIRRDFGRLVEAGVLLPDVYALTPLGAAMLDGIDVAAGAPLVPAGHALALPGEIGFRPDLNPRKTFDPHELDELRESIVEHGLLQKPMLRPVDDSPRGQADAANGVRYWVVMGERRVRAVGLAVEDGDWPAERPLLCELRPMSDEDHLDLALAENLHRADLDHLELGEAFEAKARLGHDNAAMAAAFKRTPEFVQQHRRLLRLEGPARARLRLPKGDPDRLTFHAALALLRPASPAPPPAHPEPAQLNLTPAEACALAELNAQAHADSLAFARGGYTPIDFDAATRDPAFRGLVGAGCIGSRQLGETYEARVIRPGPGSQWLLERNLLGAPEGDARVATLWKIRSIHLGEAAAQSALSHGLHLTPWLNLAAAPAPPVSANGRPEAADLDPPPPPEFTPDAPLRSALKGEAHDYAADHPDQAPLLPPTDEEAVAIARAADDQRARETLRSAFDHVAEQVRARLDAQSGHVLKAPAWDTADRAVWAVAEGDVVGGLAAMVALGARVGWMNGPGEVRAALRRAGIDPRDVRARLSKDSPDFAPAHEGLDLSHLETQAEDDE